MPDDNTTRFWLNNPVTTGFYITDPFNSPRAYANGRHEGIDLRAVAGGRPAEIVAAQRGVIDRIRAGNTGYGNYVRVRHEWADATTWVTWYAHLSAVNPALQVGDVVEAGQRLGVAGTTGNSTGVHLHLTLQHLDLGLKGYVVADVVDPTRYLRDVTVPVVDEMAYLADVTIPDGSAIVAGRSFNKTWRVRNNGTSTWEGFTLEHFADERMAGPDSVPLPPLKPDEVGEVTVPLTAPQTPGRQRSSWKARNARGRLFAFELFADIVVTPIARRDDALFVADVTLPAGATVEAGQAVVKTWRVRNSGDTTWDKTYALAGEGSSAGDWQRIALPVTKAGATADLSVGLTAPAAPGEFRAVWRLRNPAGEAFGPELVAALRVAAPVARPSDGATYVADMTILNGTRLSPGHKFTKTWRLRNDGTAAWRAGYTLACVGANPLAGATAMPLPPTAPGAEADVSIECVAPASAGHHRATWQARSPGGLPFGDLLVVEIEVVRPGALDDAVFLSDVTYPDGSVVAAGARFAKMWRIRNAGSSTWGPGYALAFAGDNRMNGPDSLPLPGALPGEVVEVSAPLEAPLAPGIHRSSWRARNPEGVLFGPVLFVELRVPVSSTPGSPALEDAQLEEHLTFPDGSEVVHGAAFEKTWAVRNTGSIAWGTGYELVHVGGPTLGNVRRLSAPSAGPQAVVNLTLPLTAPQEPGRHVGRWRMRNPRGEFFGSTLFVAIVVVDAPTKFDMLPYLRGDGRLYEMKHIFQMPNGPLIGQQRAQTQREGVRFYQTKNSEWEEMWADERFIYRGTDTSPGSGNFYTLMDGERYGTAWIPRRMAVGQAYRRSVTVVSRRKGNCMMNSHLSGRHVTWIRLEALHQTLTLPDAEGRPKRGYQLRDVAVFAAYNEEKGRPAAQPFERYYYAKGYGLIMWEGILTDHRGLSFLVEAHQPGERPDNVRERIPCLDSLRP
ncbi:protein of unknown function [Candidatus Promineifilum breve]|uniref:Peptidase M23 domain-containing protein n=1 Tax=Candidatus Promineifilum breve TaxID=1806508 RepID=A0A170PIY9_9CHLR|nr:NBR1-Ig-like domain-containing protein [Candidatus Promineifilum breve]CUS05137.2 protein of unknown function [Candidatus Promineifilum breve]